MKKIFSRVNFRKLNWLKFATIVLSIWFFMYPEPYKILFIILLCIPIVGLFFNSVKKGRPSVATLVKISKQKKKNQYDLAYFISFPGFVLFSRFLFDSYIFNVYILGNFYKGIIPVTIGFGMMCSILFITHRLKIPKRENKTKRWIYATLFSSIFFYSCGAAYTINYIFDNSNPTVYEVEIIDTQINKGSTRTGQPTPPMYYIKIAPWKYNNDSETIHVFEEFYYTIDTGDTVQISVKEGFLNIPWYYLKPL